MHISRFNGFVEGCVAKPLKRLTVMDHATNTGLKAGVNGYAGGTSSAQKSGVHATFIQKVLICMFAGFLAASLVQWAKVFVEGADDALNKGYKHRAVMGSNKP